MARFRVLWLVPCAILTALLIVSYLAYTPDKHLGTWQAGELLHQHDAVDEQDLSAGNATLGFESLLVLSQGTKWRVDGLRAAARASGIQLEIPPQPKWSEPFFEAFLDFGGPKPNGSAKAWLGHIGLLRYVVQRNYGSALIMEDDQDWDVAIRNQTLLIAEGVRTLTHHKVIGKDPYSTNWDVLWMGHCSDPMEAEQPKVVFEDPTVVDINSYVGLNTWIKNTLEPGERAVHYSHNPVCSFAYAVSATGAKKLLAQASLGIGGAFDLMLLHACQDKDLDCITVNPEIFDPYHPAEGDVSEVRAGDAGNVDGVVDLLAGQAMGFTDNIQRSARCMGLFGKTCRPDELGLSR